MTVKKKALAILLSVSLVICTSIISLFIFNKKSLNNIIVDKSDAMLNYQNLGFTSSTLPDMINLEGNWRSVLICLKKKDSNANAFAGRATYYTTVSADDNCNHKTKLNNSQFTDNFPMQQNIINLVSCTSTPNELETIINSSFEYHINNVTDTPFNEYVKTHLDSAKLCTIKTYNESTLVYACSLQKADWIEPYNYMVIMQKVDD